MGSIIINYEAAEFQDVLPVAISSLGGFPPNYKVPQWNSDSSRRYVEEWAHPDVEKEINGIYAGLKTHLGFKRKDIEKGSDGGGGSIRTKLFRYSLNVEQSSSDFSEAIFTRKLLLQGQPTDLPDQFDALFPVVLRDVVIPLEGKIDFNELVDILEEVEEKGGGKLKEDDQTLTVVFTLLNGTPITIDCKNGKLSIRPAHATTIKDRIEDALQSLAMVVGPRKLN